MPTGEGCSRLGWTYLLSLTVMGIERRNSVTSRPACRIAAALLVLAAAVGPDLLHAAMGCSEFAHGWGHHARRHHGLCIAEGTGKGELAPAAEHCFACLFSNSHHALSLSDLGVGALDMAPAGVCLHRADCIVTGADLVARGPRAPPAPGTFAAAA